MMEPFIADLKKEKIDGLWIFLCNACCLYTCMKQTKVFYCLSDFWKYIKPTRVFGDILTEMEWI